MAFFASTRQFRLLPLMASNSSTLGKINNLCIFNYLYFFFCNKSLKPAFSFLILSPRTILRTEKKTGSPDFKILLDFAIFSILSKKLIILSLKCDIISQKLSIIKIFLYFAQNHGILGNFSLFPYNTFLLSQNTLYNLSKTLYNLSKNSQNSL